MIRLKEQNRQSASLAFRSFPGEVSTPQFVIGELSSAGQSFPMSYFTHVASMGRTHVYTDSQLNTQYIVALHLLLAFEFTE